MKSETIYTTLSRIPRLYDLGSSFVGYNKSVNFFIERLPFPRDAGINALDAGCGTMPYSREQNLQAFVQNHFTLQKIVSLPRYFPASYKEAQIFQKPVYLV